MKRLYQKYLAIPKNGKVSDKVVLGRAAVTALCMILCQGGELPITE